jgi:hypothetical protein
MRETFRMYENCPRVCYIAGENGMNDEDEVGLAKKSEPEGLTPRSRIAVDQIIISHQLM